MRGITQLMAQYVSLRQIPSWFFLIDFYFSTVVRYTTHNKNLVWGGNTYTPALGLLDIGDILETQEHRVSAITLRLTGANLSNISVALNEKFNDARVSINLAAIDVSGLVLPDPINFFDGTIESYELAEDIQSGSSSVVWNISNHWAQFEKRAGRRTNVESQQRFFPGDTGFEFSGVSVKDVKWGRV